MAQDHSTEPRHSIQLVARRTGLTPAVIRAWERRYEAIKPSRSSTRRRLYSDLEIERLRLLRQATLAGRRIGSIAGHSLGELQALIDEDTAAAMRVPRPSVDNGRPDLDRHLEACVLAAQGCDPQGLDMAIRRAAFDMSTVEVIEKLLQPLFDSIGELWRTGNLRPHQEHLATQTVRAYLERVYAGDRSPADAPVLVVTTPSGQRHDIGAIMAAVTAAAAGWRVRHLGPELPADEIASAAIQSGARGVAISLVHPANDPLVEQELKRLHSLLPDDMVLIAGGRAAQSYGVTLDRIGAIQPGTLNRLRQVLDELRSTGP